MIEVRPLEGWKFNEEFAVGVAISGMTLASPPASELTNRSPAGATFVATTGGLRIDVPFLGEAPGEDRVRVELRYGVCSHAACRLQKEAVDLSVVVRAP